MDQDTLFDSGAFSELNQGLGKSWLLAEPQLRKAVHRKRGMCLSEGKVVGWAKQLMSITLSLYMFKESLDQLAILQKEFLCWWKFELEDP